MYMQVLPSNKATWDIKRFLIINTDGMETTSESELSSESDEEVIPRLVPEPSDVSKMLLRARVDAEVGVVLSVVVA